MMMKHVEGALDVVVKDDDAVATVGQDEGTAAGVNDRKSDAAATENVKSAAAGWWLMAAWLLRCRAEEKRRARVVKLWLLWDGKGAVGEWRVCGGGQYGLNGGRAVGASMERRLLHHGRGEIERRCRGLVGAALARRGLL